MAKIREKFTVVKDKMLPFAIFLRKNNLLTAEALFNIGLLIYGGIAINFLNMKGINSDIKIIITFPLLFFIPGYSITQLSFYENKNKLEILAMSFTISFALIPLFTYLDVARIPVIPGTKWNEELVIVALTLLTLLVLVKHLGKTVIELLATIRSKVSSR